jgi:hypothetical protein
MVVNLVAAGEPLVNLLSQQVHHAYTLVFSVVCRVVVNLVNLFLGAIVEGTFFSLLPDYTLLSL